MYDTHNLKLMLDWPIGQLDKCLEDKIKNKGLKNCKYFVSIHNAILKYYKSKNH